MIGNRPVRLAMHAEAGAALDTAFDSDGVVVLNAVIDRDAGRELKTNPAVRMIAFSDIVAGQAELDDLAGREGPA